ncbi:MAG: hypothetical protein M1828_002834 [Chrysothrix sp. TS-e1954]|nr:MAG: hypothetical protein M1828_002834 [Chrysothrix sp. TS-e1954]
MAQIRGTAGYHLGGQNRFGGGTNSSEASQDPSPLDAIREQTSKIEDMLDTMAEPVKPYLPAIGRFLIVVTFLEDALRILTQWSEQLLYLRQHRSIPRGITHLFLLVNVLAMTACSVLIIARKHTPYAVIGLVAVVVTQALGYGLIFDLNFFLRNLSVMGGLLMVLSDSWVRKKFAPAGLPQIDEKDRKMYFQLAGRVLLIFLFIGFVFAGDWGFWRILVINLVVNNFWTLHEHHPQKDFAKYDFFQILSIVGGLLLLVNMGPGQFSMDEKKKGIDDVLALLLALASPTDEVELLLISVTYGNIHVRDCLRNIISLFHTVEKERAWRRKHGRPIGFPMLDQARPIVAVGAEKPLADQMMMADYFHGPDGLGGIHSSNPDFMPEASSWDSLFPTSSHAPESQRSPPTNPPSLEASSPSASSASANAPTTALPTRSPQQTISMLAETATQQHLFTPSRLPAHKQILQLLREHSKDTITIAAIGPLTNLALAAAEDPETLLRAAEVVVMGGAIDCPGNITPLAEFNTFADPLAAARVLALTSSTPTSTLPPLPPNEPPVYPGKLSRTLNATLLPLDITTPHTLTTQVFEQESKQPLSEGSPLAQWVSAFMAHAFRKSAAYSQTPKDGQHSSGGLSLHDPLAVHYAFDTEIYRREEPWLETRDIRVETTGQWTRGACIVDRRGRGKKGKNEKGSDNGGWLTKGLGNSVVRVVKTRERWEDEFGTFMLRRIYGKTG